MKSFSDRIIEWQRLRGRHDLPWQNSRDPYRIWLSEIMLQQTQVATVIPYFQRFVARFPTVHALADAAADDVLALWSGLGYYSRARNLHATAQTLVAAFGGQFPRAPEALSALPGIGRSTAAAIAALAFGGRHAILDGNVKRVLTRHGGVAGWPGDRQVENRLWALAEARLPRREIEAYTQGMMDLGATLCTRSQPDCAECPVRVDCVARLEGRTRELPTPRSRAPLPRKSVQMLLLCDGASLLLEKRSSRGIWGGLWSLPECADSVDPAKHCIDHFRAAPLSVERLADVDHAFTHFRLHIRPVLIVPASRPERADHQWLSLGAVDALALPAPVRRIVAALAP